MIGRDVTTADPLSRTADPTPREMECLRAYALTGDYARAARLVGVSRSTLRGHLANVRLRLGVDSTVVAIWRLRDRLAA